MLPQAADIVTELLQVILVKYGRRRQDICAAQRDMQVGARSSRCVLGRRLRCSLLGTLGLLPVLDQVLLTLLANFLDAWIKGRQTNIISLLLFVRNARLTVLVVIAFKLILTDRLVLRVAPTTAVGVV